MAEQEPRKAGRPPGSKNKKRGPGSDDEELEQEQKPDQQDEADVHVRRRKHPNKDFVAL